ncbi:MAG: PilZ domain-containing protein [Methylophaga sp.]|nr:PilZ domain-containing protein [Methylophaga sp.]
MVDHNYDEKRNFVRMNIETQITFTVKNSNGQSHQGKSGDLSATGLYMSTDFALSEGDEIDIIMNPNGERLPPFVAEGTVLRVTNDEDNGQLFHVSVTLSKTS